ncbi:MAG: ROK family protein [Actinobacteria bacterium]|nr:ROK family protein [Actinomycetota bacterium]
MDKKLLGIDIGGSKVQIGLIDKELNLLDEKKVIITGLTKDSILDYIEENIFRILNKNKLSKVDIELIGISTPSVINEERDTILWSPNLPGWENFNVKEYFSKKFETEILLENDLNAAAVAEYEKEYKSKTKNIVFISIGTGIGAGIIINRELYRGENGLAGSIGWFINDVSEAKKERKSSTSGWLELNSSGVYLNSKINKNEKFNSREENYSYPKKVIESYKNGDVNVKTIVDKMLVSIGVAISNIVSLLDIGTIVMGGSIGMDLAFSFDYLKSIIKSNAQPFAAKKVNICLSNLKNASLIGSVVRHN